MSYVLRLTAAAEDDIRQIAGYLDQQDPRVGERGLIAIEQTLDRIERAPLLYPRLHRGAHRAVVPRFRLSIWYRVLAPEIVVVAVMHGRRDPTAILQRLSRSDR